MFLNIDLDLSLQWRACSLKILLPSMIYMMTNVCSKSGVNPVVACFVLGYIIKL